MSQDSMLQHPNDGPSDVMTENSVMNDLPSSLLLDHNHNHNDTVEYDPLVHNLNTNGNDTVWQCGGMESSSTCGDSPMNHPFAFWNIIRSNIEECCIPRNQRNDTTRTFEDESSSEHHIYHDTIPYEADATDSNKEDQNSDGMIQKEPGTTTSTTPATTTTMTKHWMTTNTYTIEVWNAIVTVLCLNVFMQFFTGKKK